MTRSLLVLSLLLTACTGEDKAEETGDTSGGSCDVTIKSTIPAANAPDANYRAAIEFSLTGADPTATVTSEIAGTTTLVDDGETVVFTPNAPLAPSTPYTVTLDYCGGSADLSFTTSSDGTPLTDVQTLVGRTYALDLAGARIVEPAGVGPVLATYLTQDILVGVTEVSSTEIMMIGAIGKEEANPPEQNYCDPSIPFPTADFSAQPYFQIGPQTTTLSVADYEIEIGDLEITGTFASDASYFAGGTLAGMIDTRPLAPLLGGDGKKADENAICELAGSFGAACGPCPADGEPFCLTLVADQIVAEEVAGESLVTIDNGECENGLEGCDMGPPAEGAACAP